MQLTTLHSLLPHTSPYFSKAHCLELYLTWKDSKPTLIFLCIFRTLPGLNFALLENCTFQNVKGPLQPVKVQFSNSAIYLLHICIVFHILSVFVFIYTRNRKEKPPPIFTQQWKGHIQIFNLFPRPCNLVQDLKSRRVYFQTLLLYIIKKELRQVTISFPKCPPMSQACMPNPSCFYTGKLPKLNPSCGRVDRPTPSLNMCEKVHFFVNFPL